MPMTSVDARSSSVSSVGAATSATGTVFIINALTSILTSKDGIRNTELKDATEKALELLKNGTAEQNPDTLFEPLRIACMSGNIQTSTTALDCIGKLISYDMFVSEENINSEEARELVDRVTDTVCDCFKGESTDEKIQTQIIKAILGLVLSSTMPVHQSALLKAVRTVYNIFLLSRNVSNQTIAQGSLTQIVHVVFGRVRTDGPISPKLSSSSKTISNNDRKSSSITTTIAVNGHDKDNSSENDVNSKGEDNPEEVEEEPSELPSEIASNADDIENEGDLSTNHFTVGENGKVTLKSFENRKSFDGVAEKTSLAEISIDEVHIKDAFLVFRALCKLSMKGIPADNGNDLKSHSMRSKLLSLQLVNAILHSHLPVFTSPTVQLYSSTSNQSTPFIEATKQYLCLALSRNAVSPVKEVFETSCQIFQKIVFGMRELLKKEIEVFFNEIFLPILEIKSSTAQHKVILLNVLLKLCNDPRTLVEIYLNYDCDGTSMENVYERIMNIMSKLSQANLTQAQQQIAFQEQAHTEPAVKQENEAIPSSRTTANTIPTPPSVIPSEVTLKQKSLTALLSILRSLVAWANKGLNATEAQDQDSHDVESTTTIVATDDYATDGMSSPLPSADGGHVNGLGVHRSGTSSTHSFQGSITTAVSNSSNRAKDDPEQFETAKQRKTILWDGIRKFNSKPQKGLEVLLKHGFIPSSSPQDIAKFLLTTEGLNKALMGEYLGDGEPENIAIMHAFVDHMSFRNMGFTEALRNFLQSFRLPGEAQKIDRFMLKFAEKYIDGNPTIFANADTAYVLAYSVIMLNTDLHNPVIKRRMTRDEFVRNNRGIDDGKDLDQQMLNDIYTEIEMNEIKMKGEESAHAVAVAEAAAAGFGSTLSTLGRDLQREAFVAKSEEMAIKTEALFKNMLRAQRKKGASSPFFSATHYEHVRPMFEIAWMPILAGISGPLQDSEDMETILQCLDGFKNAIRIICLFDLELERNAFITTLAKFTFLNNLGEMKPKNIEAVKCLLDIANSEGNYLKSSWKEILTCVSQLERFQLISNGVDQDAVPDISFSRRPQGDSQDGTSTGGRSRQSTQFVRTHILKPSTFDEGVATESRSREIVIATDKIFTSSANLSGTAIVDFVRSLSQVSWEEIQSSGLGDNVRTYSLQKLVEISYYNMGRIRLEWSNMWQILGDHFNQVGCGPNPHVAFFAIDSLRQLAMRFLEKEELAHFKFQKEFLKPFEYIVGNNPHADMKDMVLRCLQQMIQARAQSIKSGWRTMFGVFTKTAADTNESIVAMAFDIVKQLNNQHFDDVIANGSFADFTVCLTEFCKNKPFQKLSLHSIELLRGSIERMLNSHECPLSKSYSGPEAEKDDNVIRYWYPILFGFHDIIMTCEDTEVRTRALDYLYDTLRHYGRSYPKDFWDIVCREILFPIFYVLRSRSDVTRFSTEEHMSIWLSMTMIQALRNLIDLFAYFFDFLSPMLDSFLELLSACICQESDALARIGTSCLQKLIEDNVENFSPEHWGKIVATFVQLFDITTAHQIFEYKTTKPLISQGDVPASTTIITPPETSSLLNLDSSMPAPSAINKELLPPDSMQSRKREFKQIIVKCVLQILLIETVHELLIKNDIYDAIPSEYMLQLMDVLEKSFRFARRFNNDMELRVNLFKIGFMKQLPNMLKQESSSASTYVTILLKMYGDPHPDRQNAKENIEKALIPLSLDILQGFNSFDSETQQRNIISWTPVVTEILEGIMGFEDEDFEKHVKNLYPPAIGMLGRDLDPSVRVALKKLLDRIGGVIFRE